MINLKKIPDSPGIYFFKDSRGRIIYIGKATSLKRRVASYFSKSAGTGSNMAGPKLSSRERPIEDMIHEVSAVEVEPTKNVLEAIIKEGIAIKKYKPRYNILGRDDKSLAYLVLTRPKLEAGLARGRKLTPDPFPKFKIIRAHELEKEALSIKKQKYLKIFGPFLTAYSVILALKTLRKIFPYSDCKPPRVSKDGSFITRPCFYYNIHQCPGVCTGELNPEQYKKMLRPLILFFEGKLIKVRKSLEAEMKRAAKADNFEEAAKLRDQLYRLEHVQDVALIGHIEEEDAKTVRRLNKTQTEDGWTTGRIEGYDISHLGGRGTVGSMVVFENGVLNKKEYRHFKLRKVANNDIAAIRQIIERRVKHVEWDFPDCILIDGGRAQVNAAQNALKAAGFEGTGNRLPIVGIAKGPLRKKTDTVLDRRQLRFADSVRRNLTLLVRVRDEAHRFALAYQTKLR